MNSVEKLTEVTSLGWMVQLQFRRWYTARARPVDAYGSVVVVDGNTIDEAVDKMYSRVTAMNSEK